MGVPSTINSGLLFEKEASPRMVIFEEEPTPVAPCETVTPANFPARLSRKLGAFTAETSSASMVCTT